MDVTCPACSKRFDEPVQVCTRCRCELSRLFEISLAAQAHLMSALRSLKEGRCDLALEGAELSWSYRRTIEGARVAALSALSLTTTAAISRLRAANTCNAVSVWLMVPT